MDWDEEVTWWKVAIGIAIYLIIITFLALQGGYLQNNNQSIEIIEES